MPPPGPIDIPLAALQSLAELHAAFSPVLEIDAGFGVGIKQVAGQFTEELALIVYVRDKLPPGRIPIEQLIPQYFAGFLTDVVAYQPTLLADNTYHDPLLGGIGIWRPASATQDAGAGTLGGIVRERFNGTPQALTCGHVAGEVGGPIFQPRDGALGSSVVGHVKYSVSEPPHPPARDWASIELNGTRTTQFSVKEIPVLRGVAQPRLWEPVKKRGYATGLTHGVTIAVLPEFPSLATRQVECAAFPFEMEFARHGDSGSLVLNANDEAIGMLYRLNREVGYGGQPQVPSAMAFVIEAALNDLQVDLAITPGIRGIYPNTLAGTIETFGKVTIDGWGFDQHSWVAFGGQPAIISTYLSPNRLETIAPLGFLGTVDVVVTNKWGDTSPTGLESKFTY